MGHIPVDCLYTRDHGWIWINERVGFVGITDYAQETLGQVVYVVLPIVGDKFEVGDIFGSVETLKGVTKLYMPMKGEVIDINENLLDAPELVNEESYGDGWMIKIAVADSDQTSHLMSAAKYKDYIKKRS